MYLISSKLQSRETIIRHVISCIAIAKDFRLHLSAIVTTGVIHHHEKSNDPSQPIHNSQSPPISHPNIMIRGGSTTIRPAKSGSRLRGRKCKYLPPSSSARILLFAASLLSVLLASNGGRCRCRAAAFVSPSSSSSSSSHVVRNLKKLNVAPI